MKQPERLFTDAEESLLVGLQTDPRWVSVLQKISTFSSVPRYNPVGKNDQVGSWAYESGRISERESIISLLKLSKSKLNLESK